MDSYEREMQTLQALLKRQDEQLAAINKAESDLKDDLVALIRFWENLLATDGILFNGVRWTFRIVELYYKAHRYDDAWKTLNQLAMTKPDYLYKTRQWQIKILKKERKDYSLIQRLLDKEK